MMNIFEFSVIGKSQKDLNDKNYNIYDLRNSPTYDLSCDQ